MNSWIDLDLVLTDRDETIHGMESLGYLDTSDHVCMEMTTTTKPHCSEKAERWRWSRANKEGMRADLRNWDWLAQMHDQEISTATEILNKKIISLMNNIYPNSHHHQSLEKPE